jgi:FkbM family methyltransferase
VGLSLRDRARLLSRSVKPYLRALTSSVYGQHAEDALLFCALAPSRRGFYVDVGAFDPIEGSNTYKFYRHGWRGLTIEPNPARAWRFGLLRGGDRHLTVGVAKEPATIDYFEFNIAMLNTMDPERARSVVADGHPIVRTRQIPCRRLDSILAEYAPGKQIDLLNVDCEGADLTVLQTIDFVEQRPTVIVMEDLDLYYGMRTGQTSSEIMEFMHARGYEPIARLVYSTVYVALDWRELNRRSLAYREAAISPNLLPEGPVPAFQPLGAVNRA